MDVAGRAGSDPARIDENVMRLFIGIELPENVREGLAEIQRELRSAAPSARWVATESTHLTLKFLGEITEQRAEEVHQAMTGTTWKPFQIAVKGIGFFPGARSPRASRRCFCSRSSKMP